MGCKEVRQIIDQVRNREIPENALNDVCIHLNVCDKCREYLEESRAFADLMQSFHPCVSDDPDEGKCCCEFFSSMEHKLDEADNGKLKLTFWESVVNHPYSRHAAIAVCSFVVLALGAFTVYHYTFINKIGINEQKMEASIERLPDGAILVKMPDGREIIYIEPALEAQGNVDKALKELEEAMAASGKSTDYYHFASSE